MLEMTEALIKEGWSMAPEGSETEVMFSEALEEIKHARASAQDSDYDALIEELGVMLFYHHCQRNRNNDNDGNNNLHNPSGRVHGFYE